MKVILVIFILLIINYVYNNKLSLSFSETPEEIKAKLNFLARKQEFHPKTIIQYTKSKGIHCIASDDIAANEPIVSIPSDFIIYSSINNSLFI